jgi:hypothetical protein
MSDFKSKFVLNNENVKSSTTNHNSENSITGQKNKKSEKTQNAKKPKYRYRKPKKLTQTEFNQLQQKWYEKIARHGFKDIEWTDHSTGSGHNTPYMTSLAMNTVKMSSYNSVIEHYRQVRNFLTHYRFTSTKDKFVLSRYCEGDTYDQIVEKFIAKYGFKSMVRSGSSKNSNSSKKSDLSKKSKSSKRAGLIKSHKNVNVKNSFFSKNNINSITKKAVWLLVQHYLPKVYKWNATSKFGTLAAENDLYVSDVLIKEGASHLSDITGPDLDELLDSLEPDSKIEN